MKVVHIVYTVDRTHGSLDRSDLHTARRALQKNIEGFAHYAESRPENQCANTERKRGINPILSGDQDRTTACDNRSRGKRVANLVQKSAANVDIATAAVEQQCDNAVHHDSRGGDPD